MKVAVMQPTYLPWIGYFDLMDQVDTFVLLDDVQFSKQSWQQRNRIKTQQGLCWLSVPVLTKGRPRQRVDEVQISEPHFVTKHLKSIEMNYKNAVGFSDFMPQLRAVYAAVEHQDSLCALNHALIECVRDVLGIETDIVSSSRLDARDERKFRVADLCRELGADIYVSPLGALGYLTDDREAFDTAGVELCFHHYQHPKYEQQYPPFEPYAAAIDLVFNAGKDSLETLRSGRQEPFSIDEAMALEEKKI